MRVAVVMNKEQPARQRLAASLYDEEQEKRGEVYSRGLVEKRKRWSTRIH